MSTNSRSAVFECPWTELQLPSDADLAKTMLHPIEQRLLFYLAQNSYQGLGEIVDAGPFVGGSTVALAAGLTRNTFVENKLRRIHSFDRFDIDEHMLSSPHIAEMLSGRDNDISFRSVYDKNTSDFSELLAVHHGDITSDKWLSGNIEIAFIDVIKTWEIAIWVNSNIYKNLLPGSIVIHQNYYDLWSYFIPMTMGFLRDYFEIVAYMEWCNLTFVCKKTPPSWMLDVNLLQEFSVHEALRLHFAIYENRSYLEKGVMEAQAVALAYHY